MSHGPQCPCCAGTDVAHEIGQPCYAEYMEQMHAEEQAALNAQYEQAMEDARVIGEVMEYLVAIDRGWFIWAQGR